MTKEEFRKKEKDLIQTYIKESGMIGSMWIHWETTNTSEGKPESEWIEIFKILSANVEKDTLEITPEITKFGGIAKDYKLDEDEEGPDYVINLFECEECSERDELYLDGGDIQINEEDYSKLMDILYGDDSDRSQEHIFNEIVEYLQRCGFTPYK